jgi:hypothetical protein
MLTQLPATAKLAAVQSSRDHEHRSFPPNTTGFGRSAGDIGPAIN